MIGTISFQANQPISDSLRSNQPGTIVYGPIKWERDCWHDKFSDLSTKIEVFTVLLTGSDSLRSFQPGAIIGMIGFQA